MTPARRRRLARIQHAVGFIRIHSDIGEKGSYADVQHKKHLNYLVRLARRAK